MDLLAEVQAKLPALSGSDSLDGIRAAIRHIAVAERWLDRAREEQDEDLFNDVIYRTNQAFEGMLKEAYAALTGRDGQRLSPHQIEQHLLEDEVLTSRVMDLFTNYRQEWRNRSTHDHKLFFNDQEALLAIVSVSAFAAILLDQMIEALNYQREQQEIASRRDVLRRHLNVPEDAPLHVEMRALLLLFSQELEKPDVELHELREVEFLGRLVGFIQSLAPQIGIKREPVSHDVPGLRPDMLVEKGEERIVIELKRAVSAGSGIERAKAQLLSYLRAFDLTHGILFVPPAEPGELMLGNATEHEVDGRRVVIDVFAPGRVVAEN